MGELVDDLGGFLLSRLAHSELRTENLKAIRAMTEYSYLGNQTGICKILGRFHCYIDTRDRKICSHLLTKGVWEIQNTECMAKIIQPGMNVIDLGGNFGYFTLLMCGLIGHAGGKVYSIEANPELCALIKDSLEVNALLSKAEVINCAIFDAAVDSIELTFGNNKTMNGRLSQFKHNPGNMRPEEQAVEVPGNTLDNLIPEDEKIDFIKVDIEGSEEMFWYGSKRIRAFNQELQILMEYNSRSYKDPVRLCKSIFAEGYLVKSINKIASEDEMLDEQALLSLPNNEHVMLLISKAM
ncbi:FkbM family methyltransferase [Marinicella sp. S1101]|uniref:FkbM family methyltransferase n=1 Tax=Marinicella marina TaxID=2996016 RepID=UPI002260C7B9|nr:FkbM family methyltransferase [Marinicella marina]MCX7553023.1 FkbM family methyltransferase [Marinicella marina]MDJ1139667.1 FkbM family methyltransferase [Marinicella marina]